MNAWTNFSASETLNMFCSLEMFLRWKNAVFVTWEIWFSKDRLLSNGAFPLHGTARYGTVHFWGVFHWVLYLVPDTFLVPLRSRFHASRTVTKTWRVNSADHWLAGENRHYCVTELATRDPPLQPYPLDLNQHSQWRIGRNFCLNKRTFLHQPQNSSVVVCWVSTDVPLVDSRDGHFKQK